MSKFRGAIPSILGSSQSSIGAISIFVGALLLVGCHGQRASRDPEAGQRPAVEGLWLPTELYSRTTRTFLARAERAEPGEIVIRVDGGVAFSIYLEWSYAAHWPASVQVELQYRQILSPYAATGELNIRDPTSGDLLYGLFVGERKALFRWGRKHGVWSQARLQATDLVRPRLPSWEGQKDQHYNLVVDDGTILEQSVVEIDGPAGRYEVRLGWALQVSATGGRLTPHAGVTGDLISLAVIAQAH